MHIGILPYVVFSTVKIIEFEKYSFFRHLKNTYIHMCIKLLNTRMNYLTISLVFPSSVARAQE
jgi:hypothetical protein